MSIWVIIKDNSIIMSSFFILIFSFFVCVGVSCSPWRSSGMESAPQGLLICAPWRCTSVACRLREKRSRRSEGRVSVFWTILNLLGQVTRRQQPLEKTQGL